MSIARISASDPISLIAAESIVDVGQRASPAAGLSFPIQNMCQRKRPENPNTIQSIGIFALH
jgi:hypothetical protein